ncbi:MAG: hypothetical protein LBB10_00930, partial [Bifidobacteriaceae bacterium]|nr:hypothetical protein [Bifidobacteriaceae bacterium]
EKILKKDAWFKFGRAVDEELGDEVKVIIIASGFENKKNPYDNDPIDTYKPQSISFTPSIPNMTGGINIVGDEHRDLNEQVATEAIEVPDSATNKAVLPEEENINVSSSSLNIPPFLNELDKE